MGKLNKFALAPGSLSDIGSGAESKPAAAKKVAVKKAAPAPKPKAPEPEAADADAEAVATEADNGEAAADDANVEMDAWIKMKKEWKIASLCRKL